MHEALRQFVNTALLLFRENFFSALIFAVPAFFTCLYFSEHGLHAGLKAAFRRLKDSAPFRWKLPFFLYLWFLAEMTILSRTVWTDPFHMVLEGWEISLDANGAWNLDPANNVAMFLPFIFLLFQAFPAAQGNGKLRTIVWRGLVCSFLVSCFIESWQLFFSVGYFQFCDIAYNTLGGGLSALFYLAVRRVRRPPEKA